MTLKSISWPEAAANQLPMSHEEHIKRIIEGIIDFKVIPFFGAGMSKPLGLKDWNELVAELKSELSTATTDNLRLAQEYEDTFGRQKLISKLKEFYTIEDITAVSTDNHQLILAMAPPIIYTTNYDDALELTAKLINRPYYKVACLKHAVNLPHKANIIVKFHGDFSEGSEIVLTDNDYTRRMQIQHPLDILFRAHLLGKSIFFMGYALRDKNVDLIFDMHSKLYGSGNLPPSYLVAFGKSNQVREEELKSKNIHTILLESPQQLHEILRNINKEVFDGDYRRQMDQFFGSHPQELLLEKDVENLMSFWKNSNILHEDRAGKIEKTLSLKLIPTQLQPSLISFLQEIVEDITVPNEAIDVLLRTLFWTTLNTSDVFQLAISIMTLTEREYYRRKGFEVQDPIQIVEHLMNGDKGTVLCIFSYLIRCNDQQKRLSQDQLEEIIYTLRACKYDTINFGPTFTKKDMDEILNIFLEPFPGWRPLANPIRGASFNQLNDLMMDLIPKDLLK
jgi:hypothetical protein